MISMAMLSLFLTAPASGEAQAARYWRAYHASADSAFLQMCAVLDVIALAMKMEKLSEDDPSMKGLLQRAVVAAAAPTALSLRSRYEKFEVATPPAGLEAHHEQVGRLFNEMDGTVTTMADRAIWATCDKEQELGLSCDGLSRRMQFTQGLVGQLSSLGLSFASYLAARERLTEELATRGFKAPPFANPKCVTVEM